LKLSLKQLQRELLEKKSEIALKETETAPKETVEKKSETTPKGTVEITPTIMRNRVSMFEKKNPLIQQNKAASQNSTSKTAGTLNNSVTPMFENRKNEQENKADKEILTSSDKGVDDKDEDINNINKYNMKNRVSLFEKKNPLLQAQPNTQCSRENTTTNNDLKTLASKFENKQIIINPNISSSLKNEDDTCQDKYEEEEKECLEENIGNLINKDENKATENDPMEEIMTNKPSVKSTGRRKTITTFK